MIDNESGIDGRFVGEITERGWKFLRNAIFLGLILFLSSCRTKTHSNTHNIIGTWLSDDCILYINDTTGWNIDSLYADVNTITFCSITRHKDSIILKRKYRFEQNLETNTYKYVFKVLNQSDSFLNLSFISGNANNLGLELGKIKFIRKQYLIDTTIKLQKIIFQSSPGFGGCTWLNTEIDSNKDILFKGQFCVEGHPFDFDKRTGNYKGILKDAIYKNLVSILQTCDLRNVKNNNITEMDGSSSTIIVYFNGLRKEIDFQEPPIILNRLLDFFSQIYSISDLHKTNEKFEIEDHLSNLKFGHPK